MNRRSGSASHRSPSTDGPRQLADGPASGTETAPAGADGRPRPDLSGLPVAGLTRRRMLTAAIVLAVAWLAVAFLRQVGDVTTAAARAEALFTANAQLYGEIAALDAELRLIQRPQYVAIQARAHGLGESGEIPFALEQPLPSLAPDAPGSAGLRVGAMDPGRTPLDAWLTLLFGPAD